MCGRFVQTNNRERLQRVFNIQKMSGDLPPSYNMAPTQPVLAIAEREGERRAVPLKWGLVPAWATDPSIGQKMINARSESVTEKPAFRTAFKKRRCLIPADGFYEWLKRDGEKLPFYIHLEDDAPIALAGLWEVNEKTGETLSTCTILTTEANPVMAPIHHRMPVILPVEDHAHWLNPDADPEMLVTLLRPYERDDLTLHPVSKRVNTPRNNDPSLIDPVEDVPTPNLLDATSDTLTRNPK